MNQQAKIEQARKAYNRAHRAAEREDLAYGSGAWTQHPSARQAVKLAKLASAREGYRAAMREASE